MQMITDGIVIKENDVGEYDRAITVLTRDFGIIHAFAVGARRLKSKKNTSTSLLAYSRFSFADNGKSIRVDEATPIEMFFPLRYDIVRLSAAQYICELCGTLAPREEPAEMFLRIVLNTIFFLTQPERDPLPRPGGKVDAPLFPPVRISHDGGRTWSEPKILKDAEEAAKKQVRLWYVLDAIAKEEKISASAEATADKEANIGKKVIEFILANAKK